VTENTLPSDGGAAARTSLQTSLLRREPPRGGPVHEATAAAAAHLHYTCAPEPAPGRRCADLGLVQHRVVMAPHLLLLLALSSPLYSPPLAAASPQGEDCPPEEHCRPQPGEPVCNGRGACICGQCQCDQSIHPDQVVSGQFCECDNFSCNKSRGRMCGGEDRGSCECGACRCRPGWSGDACGCPADEESCLKPGDEMPCSGHGSCECGQCRCTETAQGRYSGKYCEDCPTCETDCPQSRDCVECLVFKAGPLKESCSSSCGHVSVERSDQPKNGSDPAQLCSFRLAELSCRYKFYIEGSSSVRLPAKLPCPGKPGACCLEEDSSAAARQAQLGPLTAALALLCAAAWRR